MVSLWDLQLVFRTVHNLREKWLSALKCRQMIVLPQRSSFEVIPDIRNGMKIFSPVSGWMMACVQRAWHRPHAVRSPEASACGGVKKPELAFTYLLDLLGFPQLQEGGSKSRRTTVNLNCYLLGAYMRSCDTSTSPMWHQHQYSPHGQRLQEKVYRGCSHQEVWCILSAVSIYIRGKKSI